jgi:hypothetical protein
MIFKLLKTYSLRKVEQPGEKNRLKPGCLPYALSVKSLSDDVGRLPHDESSLSESSFLQYFRVLQPLLLAQQIIKTV